MIFCVSASGWGGGSFCGLSVGEAQRVKEHRGVRRCFLSASPGMGGFCSCFPRVSVRIRVLTGTYNRCVIGINLRDVFSGRFGFRGKIGNL